MTLIGQIVADKNQIGLCKSAKSAFSQKNINLNIIPYA
jgi:hypothetical protein